MQRFAQAFWFVLPAVLVTACPLYPSRCDDTSDCAAGYVCDATGACVTPAGDAGVPPDDGAPARCDEAGTCLEGLVCDRFRRCVPPTDTTGGASGGGGGASGGDAG